MQALSAYRRKFRVSKAPQAPVSSVHFTPPLLHFTFLQNGVGFSLCLFVFIVLTSPGSFSWNINALFLFVVSESQPCSGPCFRYRAHGEANGSNGTNIQLIGPPFLLSVCFLTLPSGRILRWDMSVF